MFLQYLREISGGIFNTFFTSCSFYGESVSTIALIAIFYWCIDKKMGEYLAISFCFSNIITIFVKNLFSIYRPWVLDSKVKPVKEALPHAGGYSFPSEHSADAANLFGGLALRGKYSKAAIILCIVCLLLIVFSRLYLGVHFILDVIGGVILAIVVLIIMNKVFDKLEENPNLDIIISVVGLILLAIVTVITLTKSYPIDYDSAGKIIVEPIKNLLISFKIYGLVTSLLISWPIERRFINFSHEGTTETKIIRYICGLIGIGLISYVITPVIGFDTYIQNFAGTFILGLFIMLIYPAIIKYFQNRATST